MNFFIQCTWNINLKITIKFFFKILKSIKNSKQFCQIICAYNKLNTLTGETETGLVMVFKPLWLRYRYSHSSADATERSKFRLEPLVTTQDLTVENHILSIHKLFL